MMYWKLLDARQKWRAGKPATLSRCIELFEQRVFETQVTVAINRFAVTSLSERAATDRLKVLADELESLSNLETTSSGNAAD